MHGHGRPAKLPGYLMPIIILTAGYALFQTANNTTVMKDVPLGQRGVVSGLPDLSRSLELITGAAAMGTVFAFATAYSTITAAPPASVAEGTRTTFAKAAVMIRIAITLGSRYPDRPAPNSLFTTSKTRWHPPPQFR
jgi:hypothetical protein